jgi:hypothetical protein
MQIDLEPSEYRSKRLPKVKFSFFEALSFSIGSTLATRKKAPPDPAKTARLLQAASLGAVWYFTHHL